jgi:hypothetical protein
VSMRKALTTVLFITALNSSEICWGAQPGGLSTGKSSTSALMASMVRGIPESGILAICGCAFLLVAFATARLRRGHPSSSCQSFRLEKKLVRASMRSDEIVAGKIQLSSIGSDDARQTQPLSSETPQVELGLYSRLIRHRVMGSHVR